MTSPSIQADLAAACASAGLPVVSFIPEVGSTNDEALALAEAGAVDFTAVLAEEQRSGRGRRGRTWVSPPGAGMYLSIIVRDNGLGADVSLVTLAAGVAVAQAVGDVSGLPVELKWPNDVVIGRPWRKLAGILCEASAIGTSEGVMVVGIGVNMQRAAYPPEVADRATSLDAECDRPVALIDLVVACLVRLREQVTLLRDGRGSAILEQWRQFGRDGLNNRAVTWSDSQGPRRGFSCGLSDTGALLVRVTDGSGSPARIEHLIAGDVQWERWSRD